VIRFAAFSAYKFDLLWRWSAFKRGACLRLWLQAERLLSGNTFHGPAARRKLAVSKLP
jgi:hypothetical protein